MRAVKDGLPVPYGEGEESEGPRSTAAVDQCECPSKREKQASLEESIGWLTVADAGRVWWGHWEMAPFIPPLDAGAPEHELERQLLR